MFIFDLLEKALGVFLDGFEKIIKSLGSYLIPRENIPHPFSNYSAQFVSSRLLLSKKATGFCLDGQRQLSDKHSFRNALIVGGTGVGKSTIVLIPSLLKLDGTLIIHDPSGELYDRCAADLQRRGHQVHILDFSSPERSIRYNPIQYVKSVADANKLASLLVYNTLGKSKGDPFWSLQATSLLSVCIRLVKREPEQRHHFREVRQMIQRLSIQPDRFLEKMQSLDDLPLRREVEAFFQFDDKVKGGVIATVLSALYLFQDDTINQVTAGTGIRLNQLRQQKTALFIQNPLSDQRYYAALTSMFFEQLFANLLRWLPEPDDENVFCLIDEAGVLRIPSLADAIANVRKYRTGILLAVQDEKQLVSQYGVEEAQIIVSNCFAKQYFAGQSLASAMRIEELAGSFVRVDETGQTHIRPLITRDEVRTLPIDKAMLLAGNYSPMLLHLKPYFQHKSLLKRTKAQLPPNL